MPRKPTRRTTQPKAMSVATKLAAQFCRELEQHDAEPPEWARKWWIRHKARHPDWQSASE